MVEDVKNYILSHKISNRQETTKDFGQGDTMTSVGMTRADMLDS